MALLAGFGGGNFASSMANISYFFPDWNKGFALGLNAVGGNIGVSIVQFLVPVVIGIGFLPEGSRCGAGFTSTIAAYGAFTIPKSYGTSTELTGGPEATLYIFIVFYVVCCAICW